MTPSYAKCEASLRVVSSIPLRPSRLCAPFFIAFLARLNSTTLDRFNGISLRFADKPFTSTPAYGIIASI